MAPDPLPVLLPDCEGRYEVLFLYPERWEQTTGFVVEAPDQRTAVALACRRRSWYGSPLRGASEAGPPVLPIGARVRYSPDNPNEDKTGRARCMRWTATAFWGGGRKFERLARFEPVRPDLEVTELEDPENWRQA